MTGIGGDCFAIVAKPGAEPVTINGSGRSPAGATLDFAAEQGVAEIADNAPLAVTVPGAVDAWCRLHADYGRLDLAEVLEPAARHAKEGYPVAPRVAFDWGRNAERLRRLPATAAAFLPGGRAPREGDVHPPAGARRDAARRSAATAAPPSTTAPSPTTSSRPSRRSAARTRMTTSRRRPPITRRRSPPRSPATTSSNVRRTARAPRRSCCSAPSRAGRRSKPQTMPASAPISSPRRRAAPISCATGR